MPAGAALPMDVGKTRGAAQPRGEDAPSSHGGTSGRDVPGFAAGRSGQRHGGASCTLTNCNKSNPSGLLPSAAWGVANCRGDDETSRAGNGKRNGVVRGTAGAAGGVAGGMAPVTDAVLLGAVGEQLWVLEAPQGGEPMAGNGSESP